jgi:MtN3 and saliva related transmembrane protein
MGSCAPHGLLPTSDAYPMTIPSSPLADFLGGTAAVLTTASFFPQLLRIWRTRSAHAVSASTYTIFLVGVLLWIVYGILIAGWPIIIANTITALEAIAILVLKLRFARRRHTPQT